MNPRRVNAAGHVLALRPEGDDATAADWSSEIVLLGGDPGGGRRRLRRKARRPGWWPRRHRAGGDGAGRLWIGTDQQGALTPTADGLFVAAPPGNAVTAAYFAPRGAAIGGAVAVGGTLFIAVRHPGAEPGASFDRPGTRWPGQRPDSLPQTTLVSLTRTGG